MAFSYLCVLTTQSQLALTHSSDREPGGGKHVDEDTLQAGSYSWLLTMYS